MKEIFYRVSIGEWVVHTGDLVIFILDYDCLIDGFIEFYAVDNAENQEETKQYCCIDIDQEPPSVDLTFEIVGGNPIDGWEIEINAEAFDECSGMDRVEFYLNDVLQETVVGPGPSYVWGFRYKPNQLRVCGLIRNLEVTEEYVNFHALIVLVTLSGLWIDIKACAYDIAGNVGCDDIVSSSPPIDPGIYLFKNLTLPNNYLGYIGNFLICAIFIVG